jgi:Transcriptional regulator
MPEGEAPGLAQKDRIVNFSAELFFRYGYMRVTVDEIAAQLHISKTTFYKFYRTKEDLLDDVISSHFAKLSSVVADIMAQASNSLEQLKQVLRVLGEQLFPFEPWVLQDIRINVPKIWQRMQELQSRFVSSAVETLLRKGIDSGLLRADLDPGLVANLMVMTMRHALKSESLQELSRSVQDVFQTMVSIFFQGIVSEPGKPCRS